MWAFCLEAEGNDKRDMTIVYTLLNSHPPTIRSFIVLFAY